MNKSKKVKKSNFAPIIKVHIHNVKYIYGF